MQITPNSNVPAAPGVPAPAASQAPKPPQAKVDIQESANLERALNDISDVRPEKVAAAKALVQDPAYPGESTLGGIAGLLADHLSDGD